MKKLMMILMIVLAFFVVSCEADSTAGEENGGMLTEEELAHKNAFLAQVKNKSAGGYFDSPAGLAYMEVVFGDDDKADFKLGVALANAEAAESIVARDATFSEGISDNTANYTYTSGNSGGLAQVSFRVDGDKFFMKFGGGAESDNDVLAILKVSTKVNELGNNVADGAEADLK